MHQPFQILCEWYVDHLIELDGRTLLPPSGVLGNFLLNIKRKNSLSNGSKCMLYSQNLERRRRKKLRLWFGYVALSSVTNKVAVKNRKQFLISFVYCIKHLYNLNSIEKDSTMTTFFVTNITLFEMPRKFEKEIQIKTKGKLQHL